MPRICTNCGYDHSGLDPRAVEVCPECGYSTSPNSVGRICPGCKSDLSRVDPELVQKCPECGRPIEGDVIWRLWPRSSRRWWRVFWFTPLLTAGPLATLAPRHSLLFAAAPYLMAGPFLAFLAAWYAAYRALRAEVLATPRKILKPMKLASFSLVFALQWGFMTLIAWILVGLVLSLFAF